MAGGLMQLLPMGLKMFTLLVILRLPSGKSHTVATPTSQWNRLNKLFLMARPTLVAVLLAPFHVMVI